MGQSLAVSFLLLLPFLLPGGGLKGTGSVRGGERVVDLIAELTFVSARQT